MIEDDEGNPWPVRKDEIDERDGDGLYLVHGADWESRTVSANRRADRLGIDMSFTGDGLKRFWSAYDSGAYERDGYWLVLPKAELAKPPGSRVWLFDRWGSGSGVLIGADYETEEELDKLVGKQQDEDID